MACFNSSTWPSITKSIRRCWSERRSISWASATARAGSSATRGRSTALAGHPTTSQTPTSSGRCAEAEVKEDISREINAVAAKATESDDPYLLALAGLSLLKRGQNDAAMTVLKKLQAKQKDDGSLIAAQTSITHSGGTQLAIETTSLGRAGLAAGQ